MPAYKDKDRGTWYASFYYTDWQGKRKLKKKRGFARKKDAEAFEREFLLGGSKSCDMSFGSLADIYMEDMRPRLRMTTIRTKENIINHWLLPYLKDMRVSDITEVTIRKWQGEILKQGLSQTYNRSINAQLSAIMNYAVRYYGLQRNLARDAGLIGTKKTTPMDFWTVEEFNTFIACVPSFTAEVAFSVLFWTGMRIGELLALSVSDVDLQKNTISISKSFQTYGGVEIIDRPKTDKGVRTVEIPQKLADLLRRYINGLYKPEPEDRLFPYTKSAFYRWMNVGCKRSGVKKIRIHDLRHSHAAWLINQKYPILMVSERLGHEDVQTTLRIYGHLYNQTTAEAIKDMEKSML